MELSNEEMRILAAVERAMDSGEQPFVVCGGGRWAFPRELLEECGIESGQTVTYPMVANLMHRNLALLETNIAIQKAQRDSA
ncbi:MAG: hypothetical protein AB2799_12595 [Candidatus Thiodiazotropha sp.]